MFKKLCEIAESKTYIYLLILLNVTIVILKLFRPYPIIYNLNDALDNILIAILFGLSIPRNSSKA